MEYKNNQLCRLCLKIISDKNFKILDKSAIEMLDVLVLKLALDLTENRLMCTSCAEQLVNCFNFKSTCLYTEDQIVPYIDTNSTLNLKEVYMKEKGGTKIEDGDICRLCFTVIASRSFRCYNEVDEEIYFVKDMFPKYFPELDMRCTEDPKICTPCVECLQNYLNFSTTCLEVDNKIAHFIKGNELDDKKPVQLASVMQVTADGEPLIKNEVIEIKSEATDNESITLNYWNIDNVKHELGSVELKPPNYSKDQGRSEPPSFKCKIRLLHKNVVIRHQLIRKSDSKAAVFKCEHCFFKTIYKHYLGQHISKHKAKSDFGTTSTCGICLFETRSRSTLKLHMLTHKNPLNIQMYICSECEFQTKCKITLIKHMLIHKNPMSYKCDQCSYNTKLKHLLTGHMSVHKDSKGPKRKLQVQRHLPIHSTHSEFEIVKMSMA